MKPVKGLAILWVRLTEQGIRATWLWALDHLVRRIKGAPIRSVSQITPLIHVGGQYKKRGWQILQERGVSAVVNLRDEYDDLAAGIAPERYLYLATIDDTPPTLSQLREGAVFIQSCVRDNAGVYIHCASGVGRAPTMAAAYFIVEGLSLAEAVKKISAHRPFIRIMDTQVEQLKVFEAEVHSKKQIV